MSYSSPLNESKTPCLSTDMKMALVCISLAFLCPLPCCNLDGFTLEQTLGLAPLSPTVQHRLLMDVVVLLDFEWVIKTILKGSHF